MNAVVERSQQAPILHEQSTSLLQVIERAARDPSIDIDKMERLLVMQERIVARNAEAAFNAALTAAQSEMGPISADATNPNTRSKYATYAKLDKSLRPIYTRHGFALSFDEGKSDRPEYVLVLCRVSHIAGHSHIYKTEMPADGKGAKGGDVMTKTHAVGAAKQYGMRYLLRGIFNVAVGEGETDGNAPACITEKQAADLRAYADEVGANRAKFLKFMNAEDFEHIPAKDYQRAMNSLNEKKAARK